MNEDEFQELIQQRVENWLNKKNKKPQGGIPTKKGRDLEKARSLEEEEWKQELENQKERNKNGR